MKAQTTNSLAELEQDFGKPRKEWSLEEWKQAAIGNSMLLDTANVIIHLLEEQVAIFKEYTPMLERDITQLESRRVGRPKMPLCALALYGKRNKRKRGRPKKEYTDEDGFTWSQEDIARDHCRRIDLIKAEQGIKTDKDAVAFRYRKQPLRIRTYAISYVSKLLSKHRKLIAKIE